MKLIVLLVTLSMTLNEASCFQRICKTQVLRAFGLHSRISANTKNALCPGITYNCCSKHDQMRIHKNWANHHKNYLLQLYLSNQKAVESLNTITRSKDQYNLKSYVEEFQNATHAPEPFINHLLNLVGDYDRRNSKFYDSALKTLKTDLVKLGNALFVYRQSFWCTICDWRNHININPQSMTVSYSQSFSLKLIVKYIDTLSLFIVDVMRLMGTMHEFLFLTTGQQLFDPSVHTMLRRYALIVEKCKTNPDRIDACSEVVREFNLNKFSFLWDGEAQVLKDLIDRYQTYWEKLREAPARKGMFKFDKKVWTRKALSSFIKKDSVLSKRVGDDLSANGLRRNTFDLQFKSNSMKSFIEHKHPTNQIQIETLDDELSSLTLYKMAEPPIDISKFLIVFDGSGGIDLDKDSQEMNFDVSVEQLLAMIQAGTGSVKDLDEVIDSSVIDLLKEIQISDLAEYRSDPFLECSRINWPKSPLPRALKHVDLRQAFVVIMLVVTAWLL